MPVWPLMFHAQACGAFFVRHPAISEWALEKSGMSLKLIGIQRKNNLFRPNLSGYGAVKRCMAVICLYVDLLGSKKKVNVTSTIFHNCKLEGIERLPH